MTVDLQVKVIWNFLFTELSIDCIDLTDQPPPSTIHGPRASHGLAPIIQDISSTLPATEVLNKLDVIIEQNASIISKLDSILDINVRHA